MHVLIVEDHHLLAVGLELLLEEQGHDLVGVVSSGEQAVAAAEQHRPDLIIMDIALEGGMDGIDAAREIRSRLGIRSLFFTGVSDPETRQRAIAADPIAFLDKTSSPDQLRQVIAAIERR